LIYSKKKGRSMPPKPPAKPAVPKKKYEVPPVIEPNTGQDLNDIVPPEKPAPKAPSKKKPAAEESKEASAKAPASKEEGYKVIPDVNAGTVYLEKSLTKNLGEYNSAKITVGVNLPINYTPEQLVAAKETINVLNEIIDGELESQVALIDAAAKEEEPKGGKKK
jgi:hypothetical protein